MYAQFRIVEAKLAIYSFYLLLSFLLYLENDPHFQNQLYRLKRTFVETIEPHIIITRNYTLVFAHKSKAVMLLNSVQKNPFRRPGGNGE